MTNMQAFSSSIAPASNLVKQARAQWQAGNWKSLAELSSTALQQQPERAELALLKAAALLQNGDATLARHYLGKAVEWGASSNCVSRILVAGMYSTLWRAAAVVRNREKTQKFFLELMLTYQK